MSNISEYPPYACSCCGVTNGDMFEDRPGEITPEEIAEFKMYRKMWQLLKKEREVKLANVWGKGLVGRKQPATTRAKISATLRKKRTQTKTKERIE